MGSEGSLNRHARLTEQDVLAIRKAYKEANGRFGIMTELARQYDIKPNTVENIIRRRSWKHIGGYQ
jgi:predicted DNA binding protein